MLPFIQSSNLLKAFLSTRKYTEELCEPLETEDFIIQTIPDVSPAKWHLAHTSWFFETFLLREFKTGYSDYHPLFNYLFNSYYNSVGVQFCRPRRGTLSRPTVSEVFAYRNAVDEAMGELLETMPEESQEVIFQRTVLGIHHEQQHQELMLTDIKNGFAANPLRPVYRSIDETPHREPSPLQFHPFDGGVREIGFQDEGFHFDNESPRHRVFIEPYQLSDRLITAGEYMEFMADGGYQIPTLWLSIGWNTIKEAGWEAPYYWEKIDGLWHHYTLSGFSPVDPAQPVTHVSYFEADAFARWAGARLPTEQEWEQAALEAPLEGNLADHRHYHPLSASKGEGMKQLFGDCWEWTKSPYDAYPGFAAGEGALGEYNGKFMCNQYVLRGGSCATAKSHIRPTYRNFFPPDARWQFTGIRLAKDGR